MGGSTQVLSPVKIEKGELGACFLCDIIPNLSKITSYERRILLSPDGLTITLYDNYSRVYYNVSYSAGTNNAYLTLEKVVAYKYSK